MPPTIINGKNIWAAVQDDETFLDWAKENMTIEDFFALPGIAELARNAFVDDFVTSQEEQYDADYVPRGRYTLHQSPTLDPEDSDSEPVGIGYSLNPQSLIEIGKRVYRETPELARFFIYDETGQAIGFVGDDENGEFTFWVD